MVAVEIGCGAERVVSSVQQPTAQAGAVRRHHRRGHAGPGLLEDADAPRAGNEDLGAAITVVVSGWTEMIVGGVEQPAPATRTLRRLRGIHHRVTRLSQNPDAPWAGDEAFGAAVAVVIRGAGLIARRFGNQFAQVRTVADALAGGPVGSVLLRRAAGAHQQPR